MSELDPREGNHTVWMTATQDNEVLPWAKLSTFTQAAAETGATVRVTNHDGLACLSIRGSQAERNATLALLGSRFLDLGCHWQFTTSDFAWLRTKLERDRQNRAP